MHKWEIYHLLTETEKKLEAIRTITHRHYTTPLPELTEGKDEIYAHLKLVKELQKVLGEKDSINSQQKRID